MDDLEKQLKAIGKQARRAMKTGFPADSYKHQPLEASLSGGSLAVRELYLLFRRDPDRRKAIEEHVAFPEVRLAFEAWRLIDEPSEADEYLEPIGAVLKNIAPEIKRAIELFCESELARLEVRDRQLLVQLIDAWIETAFNIVDSAFESCVHQYKGGGAVLIMRHRKFAFIYKFDSRAISDYKRELSSIDAWLKGVVRPRLESAISPIRDNPGRQLENTEIYATALYRVRTKGKSVRGTAKDLLGDPDRRSDLKDGMKLVTKLLGGGDAAEDGPGA